MGGTSNDQLIEGATFQSGRYNKLEQDWSNGELLTEHYRVESNRIRNALIALISEIPEEWVIEEDQTKPNPSSNHLPNDSASKKGSSTVSMKNIWGFVLGLIAVLAGVAEFSGYSLRDILPLFGREDKKTEVSPESVNTDPSTSAGIDSTISDKSGEASFHLNQATEEDTVSIDSPKATKHSPDSANQ